MKRHSVLRSSSHRPRRLTLSSPYTRGVEFGSPIYVGGSGDQQSRNSSLASTPTGSLTSSGAAHLLSDSRLRDEHEGVQRTSLRRKSLALACAVSVDLAADDEDSRNYLFFFIVSFGLQRPFTATRRSLFGLCSFHYLTRYLYCFLFHSD